MPPAGITDMPRRDGGSLCQFLFLLQRFQLIVVMQVLRWSALGLGIFYGFSHQRSINATQKAAHDKHEFEKKQKAIDAAKAEFAKRHPAPSSGSKDRTYNPGIRSFLDGMPG
jgi:hypothetical protein